MTRDATDKPAQAVRLRMTSGALMVWVATVAVAMTFLRGDATSVITDHYLTLAGYWPYLLCLAAVALGIPWLAFRAERSHDPAVRSPLSMREHRLANLITVACLGLVTAAVFALALLAYRIATAS